MAIAFVSAAGATNNVDTLSFTVGSGTDRVLIASVVGDNTDNLTNLTYGGVALTLAVKLPYTSDRWNYIYYLVAPATGTADLVVTGLTYKSLTALEYTGVDQTTPISDTYSEFFSGSATTSTATLDVPTSNNWLIGSTYAPGGYASSGGSAIRTPSDIGSNILFDTNTTVGTGSQTVSVTNTSNPRLVLGVSIQPPQIAATTTRKANFSLLGVGQ